MKDWERAQAESKLAQYRDLRKALEAKRDSIEARLVFCDRKILDFERRLVEGK